jgi:WS/DGAT/MGAT family acyltransferase
MALDRLSAEDRLILWPDEVWPQDVGALGILAGGALVGPDRSFQLHAARTAVAARLHLLPRLRQVLVFPRRGLGGPLWMDAPSFDLTQHVQVAQVPAPGDEAQLLDTAERLRRRPLDRTRPLWEMWFLPGLHDDRIGLFIRLHHVVADGMAGVASLGAFLDSAPESPPAHPRPWTPVPPPSARDLLADNLRRQAGTVAQGLATLGHPVTGLRRLRGAWPAVRELLAETPGPQTSLNRVIGQDRTLAFVRGSLDQIKHIAHRHDATVNDVLLAVTAGGLRGLLSGRGEPVDRVVLPIYVPVSLRRDHPGHKGGNLISQMVVHLPLGTADPHERLRQIAVETTTRKAVARPSLGAMFGSRVFRRAILKLVIRQRVNVSSADLPGPPSPLYFAGAELLELFPLLNLLGNETLGVGALSYAGQFNIMAVADTDTYPDLDVLASGMQAELAAIVRSLCAG